MKRKKRIRIAVLAVVVLAIAGWLARYGNWFETPAVALDPGTIPGIRRELMPLTSVEPGKGFEELEFLKVLAEGKPLITAGEATRGTHEFFAMKHRLFEYLVQQLGFTVLAIEAKYDSVQDASRYVAEGKGDPKKIVSEMGSWTWNTEEFLALLRWMRAYNEQQPSRPKLKLYGFDGNLPGGSTAGHEERMAANLKWILDKEGPHARVFAWSHNVHVARLPGSMGEHLTRLLGSQVYSIGFEFNRGDFRSRGVFGTRIYSIEPAPPEFYAYALARTGSLACFVDISAIRGDDVLDSWLTNPHWVHMYDNDYWFTRHFRKMNSVKTTLPDLFDGLVFVEHSWPVAPAGSLPVQR